jgi:imidazolonepropionase-like amidohydrolase
VDRIAAVDDSTSEDERVAIWNDSEWQTADTIDPAKQAALFAHLAAHETWVCPTLIVQKMVSYSEAPEIATNPLYRFLDPWSRDPVGVADEFDPERRLRALHDHRLAVVDDLQEAGVQILAGSDTPGGFTLHWELELFVESGLTPIEALRTATINPARYLERENDHGTIEAGKFADLVLLRRNPFDDIRNTMEIEIVVLKGSVLDRAELDEMLEQVQHDADNWPE